MILPKNLSHKKVYIQHNLNMSPFTVDKGSFTGVKTVKDVYEIREWVC